MTVEEFLALPEPVTEARLELDFGALVSGTLPKFKQIHMSRKLLLLLNGKLSAFGYVDKELPFRALPQMIAGRQMLDSFRIAVSV